MKEQAKILIVDDDYDVLQSAQLFLKRFFEVVEIESLKDSVLQRVERNDYDVILLDMNFTRSKRDGEEGFYLLNKILAAKQDSVVVMITAYGDIDVAIRAMKEGAFDFILKPWKNQKLLATVTSALEQRKAKLEIERLNLTHQKLFEDSLSVQGEMIGESPAHLECLNIIKKVASTDANVLILGENGTGKELAAKKIHQLSDRSAKAFISIDLGALSESLFESELFGHSKGSFTDAHKDKPGRFELAAGGTIHLDEIGNLSLALQSKLLQVLQNRKITRLGSIREMPVDFRLICSTNKPLYEMVKEGTFREDLIFRINTVEISLPPLRNRSEDIGLLLDHFIKIYRKKYNKPLLTYNSTIVEKLKKYSWPGNIREMKHAVERAVILCDSNQLTFKDFQIKQVESAAENYKNLIKIDDVERDHILRVVEANHGNITKSAKDLGVSRTSLHRRLRKYGI